MKQLMTTLFAGIVIALAKPAIAAEALSKDIAARVEAIPIQTLTISDEQLEMAIVASMAPAPAMRHSTRPRNLLKLVGHSA